jgi:hypothetical protein
MVFRPPLLATDGHFNLDANLVADIDLLHRQRAALKQRSDISAAAMASASVTRWTPSSPRAP